MKCLSGPILESTGMRAIFQEKGKKMFKKNKKGKKYLKIFDKNVQNLKIFKKRAGDCLKLLHVINCQKTPCLFNFI